MINQRIEAIAIDILEKLSIDKAQDINPIKIAKSLDVDIRKENMGNDISGLFVVKNNKPYIRYNSSEITERQRFTIAHELGHFILHKDTPLFIDKKKIMFRNSESTTGEIRKEREANSFAASLLMPSKFVELEFNQIPEDKEPVKFLAKKFKVSEQAMTFRLANLGFDIGLY